jgi:hypothetical protein
VLITDRTQLDLAANILGWKRVLPNGVKIPIFYNRGWWHQCTVLDAHCRIEVTLSVTVNLAAVSNQ